MLAHVNSGAGQPRVHKHHDGDTTHTSNRDSGEGCRGLRDLRLVATEHEAHRCKAQGRCARRGDGGLFAVAKLHVSDHDLDER